MGVSRIQNINFHNRTFTYEVRMLSKKQCSDTLSSFILLLNETRASDIVEAIEKL